MQCVVPTWVHARVAEHGGESLVGAEVMEQLGRFRARVQRDNLLLIARAEQALGALLDAGVVPVALKGLDLLHRVYDGFDERTLDDVDLLIRPDQLRTAIDALEHQGWEVPPEPTRTHYIRSSHHLPMRSPGPVRVEFEIHWNLAQEMRFRIDEQALHARALPLEIGGRSILRLEDHDIVAHLLLHHFTHYFHRQLKWVTDLDLIARSTRLDWSEVIDRLRSWGATAAAGMALLHLHKLFPALVPAPVLAGLRVAAWRRLLTRPLRSAHPLDLFRGTRRRGVQLYLATVLLEDPRQAPRWLVHRATRDRRESLHTLDDAGPTG
jgi:hypothetical protein